MTQKNNLATLQTEETHTERHPDTFFGERESQTVGQSAAGSIGDPVLQFESPTEDKKNLAIPILFTENTLETPESHEKAQASEKMQPHGKTQSPELNHGEQQLLMSPSNKRSIPHDYSEDDGSSAYTSSEDEN